jgi:hypothetical protein
MSSEAYILASRSLDPDTLDRQHAEKSTAPARLIIQNKANCRGRDCFAAALVALTRVGERANDAKQSQFPAAIDTPWRRSGPDCAKQSQFSCRPCSVPVRALRETPYRVPTSRASRAKQSQFCRRADRRHGSPGQVGENLPCETKPICRGPNGTLTAVWTRGYAEKYAPCAPAKTKPITLPGG